jgi:DNA-binding response OmpR family regulator
VLVVDADATSRTVLSAVLLTDGFDVRQARSALELDVQISRAMAAPRSRRAHAVTPDAIVVVLRHGELTLEALCRFCVCEWGIPVVAITAFGGDEAEGRADRIGAAAVCGAPLDLDRLRAVVASVVEPVRARTA